MINSVIDKLYPRFVKDIQVTIMDRNKMVYGMEAEDLANASVIRFINTWNEYSEDRKESIDDIDSYVYKSLRRNAKFLFSDLYRHNKVKVQNIPDVQEHLYDENNDKKTLESIEKFETNDYVDSLNSVFKSMIRLLQDDADYDTLCEKLGFSRERVFKVKKNLKEKTKMSGYEQE